MSLHLNSPMPFDLEGWRKHLAKLQDESPVNSELIEFARHHIEMLETAEFDGRAETAAERA